MRPYQKILAITLVLLLGATVYGFLRTGDAPHTTASSLKGKHATESAPLVDLTPLKNAQALAQRAAQDERELAKEALRLADYELDLAYDAARHEAKEHPPALSSDAKDAKERLQKAQKLLATYEAQLAQLNDAVAKEKNSDKKDQLIELRDNAEADRDLAQDEVDDAKEDFRRAGGDLDERLQEAQQQHKQSQQNAQALPASPATPPDQFGMIHQYQQWMTLHAMQMDLWRAKQQAEETAVRLTAQHNVLDAQLEAEKEKQPELSGHAKKSKTTGPTTANAPESSDDIAAIADRKWQLAARQEALSTYDRRIDTNKQLAAVYGQWIATVAGRQRSVLHKALGGLLVILVIGLTSVYFATLLDKVLSRLNMDRRQVQSLHTVAHVTVRALAFLLILLVIVGLPGQLGTFLGLATAGLTVGLKDFIVGFIGWFVLMGKNGIRLGDWVEINGVTGEVVEIGPFHTVLLETGNWTDSGHPTGRRVTFTNSFAIEGHYFNFSTSGQWLWDELQLVLPAGRDPYPMIQEIQKKVSEATQESAKQAEDEWRRATRSREMSSFSVAPAISVKPVVGGIEVAVRYITRASERYQLRAKLYQAAVEMLGRSNVAV